MKQYYRSVKHEEGMEYITLEEARVRGYIPYAGPYMPVTETWMIVNAVTDILRNGRDRYALVKEGSKVTIWVIPSYYRRGWEPEWKDDEHGNNDQASTDAGQGSQITEEEPPAPTESKPEDVEQAENLQGSQETVVAEEPIVCGVREEVITEPAPHVR